MDRRLGKNQAVQEGEMNEPKTANDYAEAFQRVSKGDICDLFRQAMLQAYRQGCSDCLQESIRWLQNEPTGHDHLPDGIRSMRDLKRQEHF